MMQPQGTPPPHMPDTHTLSVIIPVYNVADYISECLDSILAQTLTDFEVICINDGSTDSSPSILEEYAHKDPRIHVVHQANRGYGSAVNHGLDKAQGEFISIIESDDLILPHMYATLVDLIKTTNADFVKGGYKPFWDEAEGRRFDEGAPCPPEYDHRPITPRKHPDSYRWELATWSGIYRTSFLNRFHIRHHESPGASYQDTGFFFQTLSFAEKAIWIREPFYLYRQTNPNSSIHKKGGEDIIFKEYQFIKEQMQRFPEYWTECKKIFYSCMVSGHLWTIKRLHPDFIEAFLRLWMPILHEALDAGELTEQAMHPTEKAFVTCLLALEGKDAHHIAKACVATDTFVKIFHCTPGKFLFFHPNRLGLYSFLTRIRLKLSTLLPH